ncbi:MAG TPA: hypothetical protein VHU23_11195 [Rhizomicrobium sp.]|nr:hypothetical protein [Rhizomicrobium sp.]
MNWYQRIGEWHATRRIATNLITLRDNAIEIACQFLFDAQMLRGSEALLMCHNAAKQPPGGNFARATGVKFE